MKALILLNPNGEDSLFIYKNKYAKFLPHALKDCHSELYESMSLSLDALIGDVTLTGGYINQGAVEVIGCDSILKLLTHDFEGNIKLRVKSI